MKNQIRVFICRHGATEYTLQNRLQGTLDIPLSPTGRHDVENNVSNIRDLRLTRIVSSPLKRARETANIYADKCDIPLTVDDRLRELDHGEWEGKSITDLQKEVPSEYSLWLLNPEVVKIPNGSESVYDAQTRILSALTEYVNKYYDARLLIVTHKHIRAILQCALNNTDPTKFSKYILDSILTNEVPPIQVRRLFRSYRQQTD